LDLKQIRLLVRQTRSLRSSPHKRRTNELNTKILSIGPRFSFVVSRFVGQRDIDLAITAPVGSVTLPLNVALPED
jgi:hypothetical protein